MFTFQCNADVANGERKCSRVALWAVWCFGYQNDSWPNTSWVETCGHHLPYARGWVSLLDNREIYRARNSHR